MTEPKILLGEREMPTHWYNVQADLPGDLPPVIHPLTGRPVTAEELETFLPRALLLQEASRERFIEIPEEVQEVYRLWRPTPLRRATRLEAALDTPAEIYFKREEISPAGSPRPNTAVAQAFYNRQEGIRRLVTETVSGEWGSALCFACALFGLECQVYMIKAGYFHLPYRRVCMEDWGGRVIPSPSPDTAFGRLILSQDADHPGSPGIALREALEEVSLREGTRYAPGSVFNHVLLHQTVAGEEALRQLEKAGAFPDVLVASAGQGSDFSGFVLPFVRQKLTGGAKILIVAAESTSRPTLRTGDNGCGAPPPAVVPPFLRRTAIDQGSSMEAPGADGRQSRGMAPVLASLYRQGLIESAAVASPEALEAAGVFARAEGFLPAPESAPVLQVVLEEAARAREAGQRRVIVFNLSGHGHFETALDSRYRALEEEEVPQAAEEVPVALRRVGRG